MHDCDVISLADHQDKLRQTADKAMGLAIQLRSILRNNPSLPLPERETDDLLRALAVFLAGAETYPR